MTNHIEEMMRTAGVEGKWVKYETETTDGCINFGSKLTYPDFTTEKQLEIIKLIGKSYHLEILRIPVGSHINWLFQEPNGKYGEHKDFTQALAQLTTELMNAGELDKQKVKEILER